MSTQSVPRIRFNPDDTIRITFPFDDVKQSDHPQYGTSFNYTVSAEFTNGGKYDKAYLRATPILHQKLIDVGVGKGAVLDVTKVSLPDNKSGWEVHLQEPPASPGLVVKDWNGNVLGQQGSTSDAMVQAEKKSPQFTQAKANTNVTINDGAEILYTCLSKSEELWQRRCASTGRDFLDVSPEAIQATAATLMIWCGKKGIDNDHKSLGADIPPRPEEEDDLSF